MRKVIISLVLLILMSQFALAIGASFPIPTLIEVESGNFERFTYQIQGTDFPLTCREEVTESNGLIIEFDESEKIVNAKESLNVFGSARAPDELPNGEYTALFNIICTQSQGPDENTAGAAIKFEKRNFPINVVVVGARTRENYPEIPKPAKFPEIPPYYYIIILVIIIALILWYKHEKKEQEWTKPRKL